VFVKDIATAATASGTTYTIVTTGNAMPARYRPPDDARGACDFSGFPGTLLVQSTGAVLIAQNSGANRANVEGMVSWPLEL
ncbi:MAG TPA: hypothetical protein VHA75_10020, partial [Rugosimonospora sp.]|nr:hypothetical protein [Rugosimonospora sp.]